MKRKNIAKGVTLILLISALFISCEGWSVADDIITNSTSVTDNYYTVSVYVDSTSVQLKMATVPDPETIADVSTAIKAVTGKTLAGWYCEETGALFDDWNKTLTEDLTVHAAWAISSADELASMLSSVSTSYSNYFVLGADISCSQSFSLSTGASVTIDLGGYTLTNTSSSSSVIKNGSELVITNGNLIYNGFSNGSTISAFNIQSNSIMTLDNVTASGFSLLPQGDAAEVNVYNSTLASTVCYCVATNAATDDNYNIKITLKDSEFETKTDAYDNCAVMINVPGTLNIENCTITGQRQAVVVRAGSATIKDTTITCTGEFTGSYYVDSNWGSGNEVPKGALIIGNRNGTYAGDAIVTCYGTTVNYTGSDKGSTGFDVYMYGGYTYPSTNSSPNKAILNYDSACSMGITKGETTYTEVNQI